MFNKIKQDVIKTIKENPVKTKDQITNKQLFINSILKLQNYDYVGFQLRTIYEWLNEEDIRLNHNIMQNLQNYLKDMVENNLLIIKTVEDNVQSKYKCFSFEREPTIYGCSEEILSKPSHVTGMSLWGFKRDVRDGLNFPTNAIFVSQEIGFI